MASINSDYQAAVALAATTRNYSPSKAPIHASLRYARFTFTPTGTHADGDKVTLGSLGIPGARVIPELSSIRGTGETTMAIKFTLQKTDKDGNNAVALSAQTAQITDPAIRTAFASPSATEPPELGVDDLLKIVLNYGTGTTITLAAASTQQVEIAYSVD